MPRLLLLDRAALALALSFVAVACANVTEEPPPDTTTDPGPATGSTCPSTSTLTYESFAMDFFGRYCTRCHSDNTLDMSRHGAPRGLNWDELESIRAHADQIDKMAAAGPDATNTFMPPSDPRPTDDERRSLGEWLVCGAPE